MQGIIYTRYGSPAVIQLKEVAKPEPLADEVLIKVQAASVNAFDWHFLTADVFLIRFMGAGFFKPKNTTLGADIAGRVEAVGQNVKQFKIGDEVFGLARRSHGGFAEYVCARESALVLKPANVSFEQAASIPMAGLTALQGLRDHGQLQPGQKVLINGASGGVGTFAIQIAKSIGAEVTAVCSTRQMDIARSIGADHVIDYTQENFTRNGQHYDLIFVANGYHSTAEYKRALKPNGLGVLAGGGSPARMVLGLLTLKLASKSETKKISSFMADINPQDLNVLKELLASGQIRPAIDRCYPLTETAAALRYLGQGHAQGKVIITLDSISIKTNATERGKLDHAALNFKEVTR